MANDFLKNFDDLLQDILVDYSTLDSSPDVTEGSIVFIKGACLSSMLYGLYRYQDWISRQVFPDTADHDNLIHWASIYNVATYSTDTDSDILNRLLVALRLPPAGGTAQDYYNWAMASVTVDSPIPATLPEVFLPSAVNLSTSQITVKQDMYNTDPVQLTTTGVPPSPLALATTYFVSRVSSTLIALSATSGGSAITLTDQGTGQHTITSQDIGRYYVGATTIITPMSPQPSEPGTVQVYVVPFDTVTNEKVISTLSRWTQLSNSMAYEVAAYINNLRPVTAAANPVSVAQQSNIPIDITVTPNTLSYSTLLQMSNDIAAYVSTLAPGQALYKSQLSAICLRDGAINATVNAPAADYITPNTEVVISSSISVHI